MCGIVGYIGPKNAVPLLLDGLKKLEYRGYDSGGIAVIEKDSLRLAKKVGKLANLAAAVEPLHFQGNVGIGHTRWATHGKPSDLNAHPHTDCTGKFAIIHNGIIENYLELREKLLSKGHQFKSETDTETLVHLIEDYYDGNLEEAVCKAVAEAQGAYAIVVLTQHEPGKIVAVKKTSPMIIGLGKGEYFVASDIPAILSHTRDIYIMDDGEMAILTTDKAVVTDLQGKVIDKKVFHVEWDIASAEKGGYDHFMLKEIHEQPEALAKTMSGRVVGDAIDLSKELTLSAEEVKAISKIHIVACGTAYHAGIVGKYALERLARIPVEVDVASEFRYRDPIIGEKDLVIVISQSGETADTLAALREAHDKGAKVLAITNVVGSSVSREADEVLYTWAGPEIAVASTKAYTTQLLAVTMLAGYFGQIRGTLSSADREELIKGLKTIPEKAKNVLKSENLIKDFSNKYCHNEDAFFIGRGLDYAVAMEGSLKLKEISYIHAEAYAAGELKHGTLALIVEGVPVISLITQSDIYDKTLSNIQEVKAREATVIAVAREGDAEIKKSADEVIYIPDVHNLLMPMLTVIPLQLIAYYMSVARGCDVDQPRNLAKSVTVE
jgi:glucosamine--fructose-6-phosphate aminotransferase (isomerizing)